MKPFAIITFICICCAGLWFTQPAKSAVTDNLAVVSSISNLANHTGYKNQIVVLDSVTAHTIRINCVANFENVTVNFASGNGINLDACGNSGRLIYGMSDGTRFCTN